MVEFAQSSRVVMGVGVAGSLVVILVVVGVVMVIGHAAVAHSIVVQLKRGVLEKEMYVGTSGSRKL